MKQLHEVLPRIPVNDQAKMGKKNVLARILWLDMKQHFPGTQDKLVNGFVFDFDYVSVTASTKLNISFSVKINVPVMKLKMELYS